MSTITVPVPTPTPTQDSECLRKAVEGWGTDEKSIIQILGHRTAAQRKFIRQTYFQLYKEDLLKRLESELSSHFELLVALVSSYRYEGPEVDMRLASSEAKKLNESITSRKDNYEELIRIISTRSKAQLNATFNCYKDVYGHHINKALKSEVPEDFQDAVRVVINCICFPVKHFAKVLRLAIERHGRDEDALTRVVITRAEVDLKDIKESYAKRTSKTLEHAIASDTSGDYRNFLLTLIGKDHA